MSSTSSCDDMLLYLSTRVQGWGCVSLAPDPIRHTTAAVLSRWQLSGVRHSNKGNARRYPALRYCFSTRTGSRAAWTCEVVLNELTNESPNCGYI